VQKFVAAQNLEDIFGQVGFGAISQIACVPFSILGFWEGGQAIVRNQLQPRRQDPWDTAFCDPWAKMTDWQLANIVERKSDDG
jgi:hypothetical protein